MAEGRMNHGARPGADPETTDLHARDSQWRRGPIAGLAVLLIGVATVFAAPTATVLGGTSVPAGPFVGAVNRAIGVVTGSVPAGGTSIVVNVMSICPFVDAGTTTTLGTTTFVAGDFVVADIDMGGSGAAGAVVDGQQALSALAPLTVGISAGEVVTQLNVPFCDRPTPARLIGLSVSAAPTMATSGGRVTFTYTVTNPGGAALDGVGVIDPTCLPLTYVSGDTTPDGALEAGETWIFTCTRIVSATIVETASAFGTADGATSLVTASTTVGVLPGPVTPPFIIATDVASGSAVGVTRVGPFSSATKIPRVGQSVSVHWVLSPRLSGQLIGVEIAIKAADGSWGPWIRVTGRLTNDNGVVTFFIRSTRSQWLSIRSRFAGGEHVTPSVSPAVQIRWR
jgi:uncharacterized repeat protein (TIGR01451 family)